MYIRSKHFLSSTHLVQKFSNRCRRPSCILSKRNDAAPAPQLPPDSPDAGSAILVNQHIRLCSGRPSLGAYCSALGSKYVYSPPRTNPYMSRLHIASLMITPIPARAQQRYTLQQRRRSRRNLVGCGLNHVFSARAGRASQASRLQHVAGTLDSIHLADNAVAHSTS